jgi:hypothetical protein
VKLVGKSPITNAILKSERQTLLTKIVYFCFNYRNFRFNSTKSVVVKIRFTIVKQSKAISFILGVT